MVDLRRFANSANPVGILANPSSIATVVFSTQAHLHIVLSVSNAELSTSDQREQVVAIFARGARVVPVIRMPGAVLVVAPLRVVSLAALARLAIPPPVGYVLRTVPSKATVEITLRLLQL